MQLETDIEQFLARVRDVARREMPADIRRKVEFNRPLTRDDHARWQKLLHAYGWMGGHWPTAFGGQGWPPLKRWLFEQTLAEEGAPWLIPMGVAYVGPVIYTFGSAAQKARFLPKIQSADEFWAQGYSEPNAGSDLAGLRTRAIREGDHYIVTGQKTWTTFAQWADWMFCLTRTGSNERPQDGVSFLLIDMHSPGVTVRPIATMDGHHHVNDVFLEDVRVPVENRIGEEGKAWTYAKFLLVQERLIAAETGRARNLLRRARLAASGVFESGKPLKEEPVVSHELAAAEIDIRALEAVCLNLLGRADAAAPIGVEANVLKIRGSEIEQRITELIVSIAARQGLPFDRSSEDASWQHRAGKRQFLSGLAGEFLYLRAATIYGGSNEIQRGIIAKQRLGL